MPSPISQNLRSAPQKHPRPKTAVSVPSGYGPFSGRPLMKWVAAVGIGSARPLSAVSAVGISGFLREESMGVTRGPGADDIDIGARAATRHKLGLPGSRSVQNRSGLCLVPADPAQTGRDTMSPPTIPKTHRRVVLARRPPGEPAEADFRIEEVAVPEPGPGQFLARVVYLSLDPYMRGRMRDAQSYAAPVALGEVMTAGAVGEVVRSNHPHFKVGDIVEDTMGWQEYALGPGRAARKIDPAHGPISYSNSVLGMPGMTAYFGLFE